MYSLSFEFCGTYIFFGYKIKCYFICHSSELLKNTTSYIIVLNYPSNFKKQSEVPNYTKKKFILLPMWNQYRRWHRWACPPQLLGKSWQWGSKHETSENASESPMSEVWYVKQVLTTAQNCKHSVWAYVAYFTTSNESGFF